jgi:hypothetical protein
MNRYRLEPFRGAGGTQFIHDDASDQLLVFTNSGDEVEIPVSDFRAFLDIVGAGPTPRASTARELLNDGLTSSGCPWPELLEKHRIRPSFTLADLVLERSRLEAYADAGNGCRLAELAALLARRLDSAVPAGSWTARLLARAHAARGHALRLGGDPAEAGAAFDLARRELPAGDPDIDALEALLLHDVGEPQAALASTRRAAAGLIRRGEIERATCTLILQAALHVAQGDVTSALGSLALAGHLLDPEVHQVLALAVEEGLAVIAAHEPGSQAAARNGLRASAWASGTLRPDAAEAVTLLRSAVTRRARVRHFLREFASNVAVLIQRRA